jgi:hypothetical protein
MPATLQNILQKIKTDSTVVELQGLSGSSKALVVSMLSQIPEQPAEKIKPLVVVCESFDVAEVLLNDLYYFFGKEGVHFSRSGMCSLSTIFLHTKDWSHSVLKHLMHY